MKTKIAVFAVFIVLVLAGLCRADSPDPRSFQGWELVDVGRTPSGFLAVTLLNPDKSSPHKAAMLMLRQDDTILIYIVYDGKTSERYVLNDDGKYHEVPLDEDSQRIITNHFRQFLPKDTEV